jgi:hypothetical protein
LGCICAGPDHLLDWEAASACLHIPPTKVAIVCAKSIWAWAAEVTQQTLPSRRASNHSAASCLGRRGQICWYTHRPWRPGRLPSLLGSSRPSIKPSSTEPHTEQLQPCCEARAFWQSAANQLFACKGSTPKTCSDAIPLMTRLNRAALLLRRATSEKKAST